jgi:hypothetical protein
MNILNYTISTVEGGIEIATNTGTSECANYINSDGCCISDNIVIKLNEFIKKKNIKASCKKDIINKVKKELKCDSESCVLTSPEIKSVLSKNEIQKELKTRFKPPGPRNNTNLLNNINIDDNLHHWAVEFPKFYPCPFSMIDFNIVKNSFSKINLASLLNGSEYYYNNYTGKVTGPFDTFACVLNTDTSDGGGKHWVCIFAQLNTPTITIEYFNSSGNAPCSDVNKWMESQRKNLLHFNKKIDVVSVTNIVHQKSMTECGVYSLYYIRCRLDGIPYTYFMDNRIPDDLVTEFRKHIFRYS